MNYIKCDLKLQQHLNLTDIFCTQCDSLICSKCIGGHASHTFLHFEQKLAEINKNTKETIEEKKNLVDKFQLSIEENSIKFEELKSYHDSQIEKINEYFREIHDQLHIKEVELKRELNSYFDENSEFYIKKQSTLDSQLKDTNDFITNIQNSDKNIQEIDKINFLQSYLNSHKDEKDQSNNNNDKNNNNTIISTKINEFQRYQFQAKEDLQDTIKTLTLINSTPLLVSNVVCYNSKGLSIFNIESKSNQIIPNPKVANLIRLFYQSATVSNCLYVFDDNNKFKIISKNGTQEYDIPNNLGSIMLQSTLYDNDNSIYIIGGYNQKSSINSKQIIKYSILENKFKVVFELQNGIRISNVSFDQEKGIIHIIGGYSDTYLGNIYQFNTKQNSIKLITANMFSLASPSHFQGTYVPKYSSYYILNSEGKFYKVYMNLNQPKVTLLTSPKTCGAIITTNSYSKFKFDGIQSILLISCDNFIIYKFDMESNTWSSFINLPYKITLDDCIEFFTD